MAGLVPNFNSFKRYELYLLIAVGILPEISVELSKYETEAWLLSLIFIIHKIATIMLAFVLQEKEDK